MLNRYDSYASIFGICGTIIIGVVVVVVVVVVSKRAVALVFSYFVPNLSMCTQFILFHLFTAHGV